MYARILESVLQTLTGESEFQSGSNHDVEERFRSLRAYGVLPQARGQRGQRLTQPQLAATLLGLVPSHPKWAGHAAVVLRQLRPVGGPDASFRGSKTLSKAIERLIGTEEDVHGFRELCLSGAGFGINNHGFASISFEEQGSVRTVYFVSDLAVSLLHPGADVGFKPQDFRAPSARLLTFSALFFAKLRRELELSRSLPSSLLGDGEEYEEEEERDERYKRLGVTSSSRFLNIGVYTQVTWPKDETVVAFDRYRLVLMPRTKEHTQSIHIDLTANRLRDEEAMTVINRFLSLMAWCDDQFAVAEGGWSGNPVPVAVSKRNLAFVTATGWTFRRTIPASDKVLRALGHYREALNADHAGLVSYAVLSFYKVLEVDRKSRDKVLSWIDRNYSVVAARNAADQSFAAFDAAAKSSSPKDYIDGACRVATAHASVKFPSDVDLMTEVRRLHIAATVLRELARLMIERDLAISSRIWDDGPPSFSS